MASTYLTRTFSAGNRKTGTISVWLKRSSLAGTQYIFSAMNAPANGYISSFININSAGQIALKNFTADGTSTHTELKPNAQFRDVSAWYHIVFSWNTTLSTASDRYKLYVNGERITSFATATYPTLNEDLYLDIGGSSNPVSIGSEDASGGGGYFNGLMSHYHHTDGTAYDASAFGSTDTTTGEWQINTSPSVTYGTNGFFILKDGNSVTDQSGNSNNFTVGGGTLTKTEDNPSNVFATLNPLSSGTDLAFSSGNTTIINSTTTWNSVLGTLAFGTGKYYFEAQRISTNGTANIGITLSSKFGGNHSGVDAGRIMYSSNGYVYKDAWSLSNSTIATIGSGDIIGVSIDTENGILKFYKNGALVDTTTNSLLLSSNNEFIPAFALYDGGKWRVNFGNGYFQDNAISSAGNNASGNGIFEYDVQPTDATALSTKGLNL